MGGENGKQKYEKLDAQTFDVNFMKIQFNLEIKYERNQTELKKREEKFLQMIK